MRLVARFCVLLCICFWYLHVASGQSSTNPDISVIPRFRFETNDGAQLPAKREFSQPEFTMEEFEIALQAYLNPYARADIFLSKAGTGSEPIVIEEGYATFVRGLPLDLNLRIGKFRAEYGKLNTLHPHAWPFLTMPLSLERFLGTEGVNDLGVSASILLPTGEIYSKFTLDLLRGNSIAVLDPSGKPLAGGMGMLDTTGGRMYYANSARLMTFLPMGDDADLEIGLSGLTGIHDPYGKYRFYYGNLDVKYKWKPDAYTALTCQGEILLNSRRLDAGSTVSSTGLFVIADYQFQKIFSLGTRYDFSEAPYSQDDRASAIALFFGYYPVEETAVVRLQFQHTILAPSSVSKTEINSIALQFLFSMGPHKAHPF
jgi:hypothetical protein